MIEKKYPDIPDKWLKWLDQCFGSYNYTGGQSYSYHLSGGQSYIINADNSVDVNGTVNFSGSNISRLPFKFGRVSGYFHCECINLTTLENFPDFVGLSIYINFLDRYILDCNYQDLHYSGVEHVGKLSKEHLCEILYNSGKITNEERFLHLI